MSGTKFSEVLSEIDLKIEEAEKHLKSLRDFRRTYVNELMGTYIALTSKEIASRRKISDKNHKLTKMQTVINFLKEGGPKPRKDIVAKTRYSHGTLSFILSNKKVFKNEEGVWSLK